MPLFDFFEAEDLPAPAVTAADAVDIAKTHFGLEAVVTPLGSQQDANFLLHTPHGDPIGVLKVANPVFTRVEIEAQDAAARFLADAGVRTATNIEPAGVDPIAEITDADGKTLYARIIAFLSGGTMSGEHHLSPTKVAALGALVGRAGRALSSFDHPGVDRVLQWDLQHADRTIELLAPYVSDDGRRELVRSAAAAAWRTVAELADDLPRQVVHCDITDDNVVCSSAGGTEHLPDGIIDFGDLTHSWAVGELAVAVSSVLRHEGGEPAAALPAIAAFHHERPLSPTEIAALWPLVIMRAATLVVSGNHQAAIDSENEYATGALELEYRIFERSLSVPGAVFTNLVRHALGESLSNAQTPPDATLIPALDLQSLHQLDLGTESDSLDAGAWLDPDGEQRLAQSALDHGVSAVITKFGQRRLTRSVALSAESPATVPTGIEIWLDKEATIVAPWPGVVTEAAAGRLTVVADAGTLRIEGPSVSPDQSAPEGQSVQAGHTLATAAPGQVWVQVTVDGTTVVPKFVRPEYAPAWLAGVRDPRPLLGIEPDDPVTEDGEAVQRRRGEHFASVQGHYYRKPPRIERGWREYLLATDGRSYLDMVNNVAILGHGHPAVADAAARQWRRLNTNSRFNYASVAALSERLAATLPDPLDTVFLVNSGSEAGDLALRLAFAATGHRDVVAVREAYHGWTYATDAVSTSVADNPNALSTRPDWVHTVPSPNSYRGDHRGEDASRYAPEAVAIIERLAERGHPLAAFICEPFYGNAGGMALPDGYLKEVYAAARATGGLAIADEVQVGYGRTGKSFWSFEQQDVVPDIVTVAKAMGNGQPLGAVITTRAIAEAYHSQGYFFSSAGGSPVSCVVGLAVLDTVEREGLQHNALIIGDHLRARLTELAQRHPIIGTVHGCGLYMGVELVRDRETLEPAVAEAYAICERMRELGVIVQPTGDRNCVLKVKPPMCISMTSADFFIDILDRVLSTGW